MAETTNTHEPANGVYGVLTAGNFKPILFSTPMVQAILRGEKTQTRRIIKPQPTAEVFSAIIGGYDNIPKMARFWTKREPNNPLIEDIKLKYNVGDILWVRETWHPKRHNMPTGWKYEYKATAKEDGNPTDEPWKPSIFMPKEACRIFLKLTKIRIERLNDITEDDAIAEGIERWTEERMKSKPTHYKVYFQNCKAEDLCSYTSCPIDSYETLWQKINGEKSWEENPFVWVYEFERTDASFACR
jgi:hypothetical protein